MGVPRTYRAYRCALVEDSSCPSARRKLDVAVRVPDVGATVRAPALHEYVVVRHEALRVARPMPGAGSLFFFVGDFHSLEELGKNARVRSALAVYELVVVRHGVLRVARPVPGASASRGSMRYSVGDLNSLEELDMKDRVRLVASGIMCRRHWRVARWS